MIAESLTPIPELENKIGTCETFERRSHMSGVEG